MKFPYIPISTVIADLRGDLSRRDRAGIINDDDCLNWAIEAIREIGGTAYDTLPLIADVKEHVFTLPKNFYKIKNIFVLESDYRATWEQIGNSTIWFSKEQVKYNTLGIIYPGDSFTGSKYCVNNQKVDDIRRPSYIIRYPNVLRTSERRCKLGIDYYCLPMHEDEYLMIDEVHSIKAVKSFITGKLLYEDYLDQKIPRYLYQDIQNDYEVNMVQAQSIIKFDDPADDKAKAYDQDHRYDIFKFDR